MSGSSAVGQVSITKKSAKFLKISLFKIHIGIRLFITFVASADEEIQKVEKVTDSDTYFV